MVHLIRHAPSPSTFVLSEDEGLRQQILSVLRKKERRAAEKARRDRIASTGSEGSVGSSNVESASSGAVRKRSSPGAVGGGDTGTVSSGAEDKKKRKLDK